MYRQAAGVQSWTADLRGHGGQTGHAHCGAVSYHCATRAGSRATLMTLLLATKCQQRHTATKKLTGKKWMSKYVNRCQLWLIKSLTEITTIDRSILEMRAIKNLPHFLTGFIVHISKTFQSICMISLNWKLLVKLVKFLFIDLLAYLFFSGQCLLQWHHYEVSLQGKGHLQCK